MNSNILTFIDNQLTEAGINYEFGSWTGDIVYPYFTGEYNEVPTDSEDGYQEIDFILNGFNRGSWAALETARETIEQLFNYNTSILEDGSGVDVSYFNSLVIPQDDAELKRIQINLKIKMWRT